LEVVEQQRFCAHLSLPEFVCIKAAEYPAKPRPKRRGRLLGRPQVRLCG
jgi:hypothetical protein